ncbi:hypothetical protein FD31_GL002233 [Companilactobacillus nantensis DSM 16982]|uniref:Uncharacterized protein n=2 Tax=Companilactobacillus nantensis TaxID=305793 RepID=A0A0R1W973_9LACO|nr:hypothetical protein FD31_GL002233 [Companilactobacillus nantensis DSM 16982]
MNQNGPINSEMRINLMDDNDFILRQVKSFAEGLGMIAGKKGSPKTEIIYQQQQNQKGKIFTDLDNLLLHRKYEAAIHYVYAQKFQLDRANYYQLGEWLTQKLRTDSEVDPALLAEFISNMEKYK